MSCVMRLTQAKDTAASVDIHFAYEVALQSTMPENWKETLFVWDGIFSVEQPPKEGDPFPFKWSGTWVGA